MGRHLDAPDPPDTPWIRVADRVLYLSLMPVAFSLWWVMGVTLGLGVAGRAMEETGKRLQARDHRDAR